METVTQNLLDLLANINESLTPYSEISLQPLQEGNSIIARILSVENSQREYVDRTKRSVGVALWIVAKHASTNQTIDTLIQVEAYLVSQGGNVLQDVQWETTSDDGYDVYSVICRVSL